jgi:DNA-binding response OmpR family regulator
MAPKVLVIIGPKRDQRQMAEYVSATGMQAVVSASGTAGISQCLVGQPAIIVADMDLPDMGGAELCRRIRELTFVPLIMISTNGDEMERVIALEVGADTVMQRPVPPLVFSAMLKRVLRRAGAESPVPENVIDAGPLQLDCESHTARVDGQWVQLGPKEFALLEALASRPGYVLTKEFLLERIWDCRPVSEERALAVHISRLRRKIGDHGRHDSLIVTVPGVGYVFRRNGVHAF